MAGGLFGFLTEAFSQSDLEPPASAPDRVGYDSSIPRGGTTGGRGGGLKMARRQMMEDLGDTYAQCIWVAACVNAISRAVVAGGVEIVPDDDLPDEDVPDTPPPEVQRAMALFDYTNETQNITQLLRQCVADLLIYGDAYIELGLVAGEPVRMWNLDAATMIVDADEHGKVRGYIQDIDTLRKATFKAEQVIHISLGSPRGSTYGLSPTQMTMLSSRTWLWTAALLNEQMKQGNPPRTHVDHPEEMQGPQMKRWHQRFMMANRGIKNIANPIITKGGARVNELTPNQVEWLLRTLDKKRDEILGGFGVTPNKAMVVESGNLGGGSGESQDKTWRIDTIMPVQSLVLEALQFSVLRQGFGIRGWHVRVPEIDMRDSKVVEEIRDLRMRNGLMTLNEGLGEIGQPGIGDAGDQRILVDRTATVLWQDMPAYSEAQIVKLAVYQPQYEIQRQDDGTLTIDPAEPDPIPAPGDVAAGDDPATTGTPTVPTALSGSRRSGPPEGRLPEGQGPEEAAPDLAHRALTEAYTRAYTHRRRRALKELPRD
jgi:hypothetical protein